MFKIAKSQPPWNVWFLGEKRNLVNPVLFMYDTGTGQPYIVKVVCRFEV